MKVFVARDAIVHRMSYSQSPPPVLLAVRDLHEEIRAGFGRSMLTVRTLDGVSLVVRSGELVVLRGAVACGAASLIALLTGTRTVRSGVRIVARGVQIRRGCIGPDALNALMSGWSATPVRPLHAFVRRTPVVHVFHVRSSAGSSRRPPAMVDADQDQWRAWAMSLRAQGGSVIVHVPITGTPSPRPPIRRYGMHPRSGRAPVVQEATTTSDARGDSTGGVRVLTLAAGRIVGADNGTIDPLHSP